MADQMFHAASLGADRTNFTLVTTASELSSVQTALRSEALLALDTETTGLRPFHDSRLRLLSLCVDGVRPWVIDCFKVDPRPLLASLRRKVIVAHNWAFDAPFLAPHGFDFAANSLRDTFIASFLLTCGYGSSNSLGKVLYDNLGIEVDKTLQKSDWSGELTPEQLAYAAADTTHLLPLHRSLRERIQTDGLTKVWHLEHIVLKAVLWMRMTGIKVDHNKWVTLYNAAIAKRTRLTGELNKMVPPRQFSKAPWNWRKPWDIKQAAGRMGVDLPSTTKAAMALHADNDFVQNILEWRRCDQILKSFGPAWFRHEGTCGSVHAEFRQCLPMTGRFSCTEPNMQQIPRGGHRKCFVAPIGHSIVKADYSTLELRLMAKIAKEKNMAKAFLQGVDLHMQTAQNVLGKESPTKADRSLAKALNFGLIYGCGPKALREQLAANWGIVLPLVKAAAMRTAFFKAYPDLKRYHAKMKGPGEPVSKTPWGRVRHGMGPVMKESKWGKKLSEQFTKKCNTLVQSTAADGMKKAVASVWMKRKSFDFNMLLVVHDEIVLVCPTPIANDVAEWLKGIMIKAMQPLLGRIPCEVETSVGDSWGG